MMSYEDVQCQTIIVLFQMNTKRKENYYEIYSFTLLNTVFTVLYVLEIVGDSD